MKGHELKVMFRKEWRQLLRSKGALLTALFIPALLLLAVPVSQILGVGSMSQTNLPKGVPLPPGLAAVVDDPKALVRMMMPLFIAIGGLVVPSVSATYTMVAERESRTLELIVSLPVTLSQVVTAKLTAIALLATVVTVPMLGCDAVLLLATKTAGAGYVLALFALLLASLCFSTAGALLISLFARDFRTGNNLNALLIVPVMFGMMALLVVLPSPAWAALAMGGVLLACTVVCAFVALKVVRFEQLLR